MKETRLAIEREFNEALSVQDEHGRMERLYRWARTHGKWMLKRAKEAETFDKRLEALSKCDCVMGGHCIELICGEYDKELQ
jgi:hypothetical protein